MKTRKISPWMFFILVLAIFWPTESSIPTIGLENNLLNAQTNYIMSYYNFRQFQTASYFQIDFSQSDITVTDEILNVNATLNNTAITASLVQANCTSKVCIIKLGTSFAENTNVVMSFGQFKNPKYTSTQKITVFVYFGANSNETQTVSISASAYQPMPVTVNSITQSDFGVGSQDVTYTMNVSFSYVPKDPEISIEIPSEVAYLTLDTELTFYGTVQNISAFSTINMLIFSLKSDEISNPNGYMLLKLYGFRNPRFIGTSTSFNVSMVQKKTPTSSNCATCRVAYLYANSSKLLTVSSTTPGDITMNIFNPSSYYVSDTINLTIGIKIVAPIPEGGKFRIILPASIVPVANITCEAVYGFTVSSTAHCVYNQTTNSIETVNFSIPYLEQTGDAIIRIVVINPKDTRKNEFNFQTLDEQNRKIGKNREPFVYTALPVSLNSTVTKNTTFLESFYTLSSTITLSQTLNSTSDIIQVTLPPSEFYNLSAIQCTSSSVEIACTKSYENSTNNLVIIFSPPCSVCAISSTVSFKINNLINPSFINDDMKSVEIQTMTSYGVMETFSGSVDLKEKQLIVNQLDWQGGQQVGSQFTMALSYELPKYIQKYGGYLLINLSENSSFTNILLSGSSYTYPQSLTILNENNQSLTNTITYYETSKIRSLKQIKISLCTVGSACGANVTIAGLRKAYYPVSAASLTIKGQTLNGEAISSSVKDLTAFMPHAVASSLAVVSTAPVTNTVSNYVFKFSLNKLLFDSGLRVDLTSKHQIQSNGRCFVQTSPSTLLGYGIDCQTTNLSSFTLTYSGDVTLMTLGQIEYTITVVNVLNPPSIMPITYKVETFFNSLKTGTYSTSYALSQPYTLVVDQFTTTNSTYGQKASLSFSIKTGYYAFDELRFFVPKQNYQNFKTFNSLSSTNGSYKLTENSTHFMVQKVFSSSSIYTLALTNALSTSASGKITAEMYVQGYLSSTGTFELPRITPAYLYATASSSNRYVGQLTSLSFDIRRVNSFSQQKSMKIYFDNKAFGVPSPSTSSQLFTTDPSNPQLYTYSQQISTWPLSSKTLVLQNFQNTPYIPSITSLSSIKNINISTFDQFNSIVSTVLVDISTLMPNQTKDSVSYEFVRSSVESLGETDVTVEFKVRYQEMAQLVKIQLPVYENRVEDGSSCVVGDSTSLVACEIVDRQWNYFVVKYPSVATTNTATTKLTLKKLRNQFPSTNNLTLTIMTLQKEPIEQSTKPILPTIDSDPLEITCTANTSSVASPVKLDFVIKSNENYIDSGSKIRFVLPEKVYSRQYYFVTKDCEYEVAGIKFEGCEYQIDQLDDGKEWIQYVTVSNFGFTQLTPSTTMKLTLYLMNPWTAYPFAQKSITAIQYNSIDQQVARGSILMTQIHPNLTSFTPSLVPYFSFSQTSKQCDSQTTLNLTVSLPTEIATQTYFYITLPSVYYIVGNLSLAGYQTEMGNGTIVVKRIISECSSYPASSGVCANTDSILYFVLKVRNEKYLKLADPKPKIRFYMVHDGFSVTSNVEITLSDRIPNSITGTTIERSAVTVSQKVNTTLKYTLPSTFNTNKPIKASITPLTSLIGLVKSVQSSKIVQSTSAPSLESLLTNQELILSTTSLPSSTVEMQISGMNPSFAPNLATESYVVKLFDENFVYFINTVNLTEQHKLRPLSSGIAITRSTTLVNTMAVYTITGTLPQTLTFGQLIFNTTTSIDLPSSTSFTNLKIGSFLNPASSNWDTYESISVMNGTHVLFANDKVKTTPGLTSLALGSGAVRSIVYNKEMRINTEEVMTVVFAANSTAQNVERVNLRLPTFFKSLKGVKVNSQALQSFTITLLPSSQQSLLQIQLTSSTSLSQLTIELTFVTLQYQQIFANKTIYLQTEYPTQSYSQTGFSVNVYGTQLSTGLTLTSSKVNQQNAIRLQVTPISKANSQLIVYLPAFLSTQLQALNATTNNSSIPLINLSVNSQSKPYSLSYNSELRIYCIEYYLGQSPSSPLLFTLSPIINPPTNQPFYFIIQQQQSIDQSSSKQVFGHSSVQIRMTTLEEIFVKSAQRNTSKIGVPVEIDVQIELPTGLREDVMEALTDEECVIMMPVVQVVRLAADSECKVYVWTQAGEEKLACKMHPTHSNSIITTCKPGLNKYSITKGFKNMLYSIIPNATQKPSVYIGEPYQMAESDVTHTSFLSPIMTSGSLSLNTLVSSSSVRLQKTTLSLNLTLQNIEQVDCVNFRFEKEHYLYSSDDLKCKSNGQPAECWSSEIGSVMVNVTDVSSSNLNIQIDGLVNFLKQGNFTIKTLKYLLTDSSASVASQAVSSSLSASVSESQSASESQTVSNPISVQSAPDSAFALIDIFYSSLTDIGTAFVSNTYRTRVINPENYVSDEKQKIEVIFDDEALLPSVLSKIQLQFNITTNIADCQAVNFEFSTSMILNCTFTESSDFTLSVKLFHTQYPEIDLSSTLYTSFIYPAPTTSCENQMCDFCSTNPSGEEKCFSCRQNFYEYQNGCIQACPSGYTSYQQSMTCEQCSFDCQTCFGIYLGNCLKCQNDSLVSENGLCVESCSSGYPQSGYCLGDNECFDQGCRLCSATGFCYQCLPDYSGEPTCQWEQLLPPLFMSFFVLPFAVYALLSTGIFLFMKGVVTMTYQVIFSFSLLEFMAWVFIVPALHTKEQAMLLISMVILRIVLGIVAYETYYKKQINSHIGLNQDESLLEKDQSSQKQNKNSENKESDVSLHFDEDWRSRVIRFLAHVNGIDSYEAFKVAFSSQLRIEHNNLYLWISTGNRVLVCAFMFYVLSQGSTGDLVILPLVTILSSLAVISLRAVKSKKLQECWQKLRHPTK